MGTSHCVCSAEHNEHKNCVSGNTLKMRKRGNQHRWTPFVATPSLAMSPRRKPEQRGQRWLVSCVHWNSRHCCKTNVTYATLDAWMVSWGRWTIAPTHLCESLEDTAECTLNRKEKCGSKFRYYAMPVSSFVTYVNAVCRVVNETGGALVSSSPRQLPEFQVFIADAIKRSRQEKAVKQAGKQDAGVLTMDEFKKMMELKPENALDKQRQKTFWHWCGPQDSVAGLCCANGSPGNEVRSPKV